MFSHESEYRRDIFFSKSIIKFLTEYKKHSNLNITVGDLSLERDIGYAPEYADAIFKILFLDNSEKFIVSSNILYKLSDFIEICLIYLDINYELFLENNLINFVDKSTGKKFIKSDIKKFRNHDLRGIKGNNSKLLSSIDWKPKLNLEDICKKMIDYELEVKNRK